MNKKYIIIALVLATVLGAGYFGLGSGLKGSFADYSAVKDVSQKAELSYVQPVGSYKFAEIDFGSLVLGRSMEDPNQWHPGKIGKNYKDGTFTLNYFDDSTEDKKPINDIARFDIHPSLGSLSLGDVIIVKSNTDVDEKGIPLYYTSTVTATDKKGAIAITKFGTDKTAGKTIALSDIFYPSKKLPAYNKTQLSDGEARSLIEKNLTWERTTLGTPDKNDGWFDVKYKISIPTDKLGSKGYDGLKLSVLRKPYWGNTNFPVGQNGNREEGGAIITYGTFNLSFGEQGLKLKQSQAEIDAFKVVGESNGKKALNIENQEDGSLVLTVHVPYPDFPIYSTPADVWGKTDIDLVFTDNTGVKMKTKMSGTGTYDTVAIPMPKIRVGVSGNEVYFRNDGAPGSFVPRNYLSHIVFYASGGKNATSLSNALSTFDKNNWAAKDAYKREQSEWYGFSFGSKVHLLYDRAGGNYSNDTSGHNNLPTMYSAPVKKVKNCGITDFGICQWGT